MARKVKFQNAILDKRITASDLEKKSLGQIQAEKFIVLMGSYKIGGIPSIKQIESSVVNPWYQLSLKLSQQFVDGFKELRVGRPRQKYLPSKNVDLCLAVQRLTFAKEMKKKHKFSYEETLKRYSLTDDPEIKKYLSRQYNVYTCVAKIFSKIWRREVTKNEVKYSFDRQSGLSKNP